MKKNWIIILTVLIVIIISAFFFIFNEKLIVEEVPIIVLNKGEFQKEDNLTAQIQFPSFKNIYVVSCLNSPFSVYFLNANNQWIQKIISPENSECSPYCKNNVSSTDGGCEQKWTLGLCNSFCKKLSQADTYSAGFSWDLNFYEYENKICGNEKGLFKFAKPAPSGQYKIQYAFFDDKECKFKNSAEKIFIIK